VRACLFAALWMLFVLSGCALPFRQATRPPQPAAQRSPQHPAVQPDAKGASKALAGQQAATAAPSQPAAPRDASAAVPAMACPTGDLPATGPAQPKSGKPSAPSFQGRLDKALSYCELSQDLWQKGELDNALDALDHAYSLILTVTPEDSSDAEQQKEDLRFLISKRILQIYASRNTVATGSHNAIPIVLNSHVRAEIRSFSTGCEKNIFKAAYRRSGKYHAAIAAAFRKAGLPEELSWMPLIESGFKVHAMSRARALGLWQFISSTGYKFGLKRSRYIDERLDPYKSTRAAIEYLRELHQIFGDWTTVLAAYNCGEGRVLRLIRRQKINYLDNFWDLYERLPRETARYVPRFLATLYMVRHPEKFGLNTITVDPPLAFKTVAVEKSLRLRDIAGAIGTPYRRLRALNPELRRNILPTGRYALRVPPDKAEVLTAKLAQIPELAAAARMYAYHRVRRGETISTIARRYHTRPDRIAEANHLNRHYLIVAGQSLKIPMNSGRHVRRTAAVPVRRRTATQHVVRSGDSLWNIARRYGTTIREIQAANGLAGTQLHIGQVLIINSAPRPAQYAARPPQNTAHGQYEVKHGDSPFRIAAIHNMRLEHFLRINHLTPRSKIYPGQTLVVE